ncbi:MAG: ATP-binding protein [Nitrospira sp.]|nr:ATP-binding protein [Nitrospira sp.]MCP9475949.1 ATP-binding protein [Nitrospira sp.]
MRTGRLSYTVLLVNPSRDLQAGLARDAERLGFTLISASSPSEAAASFERDPPDVVITDLFPSDETGLALIQELRSRGETCPMVVVSSETSGPTVAKAFQAGATDYLQKPILTEEFARVLTRVRRSGRQDAAPLSALLGFEQRLVLASDAASVEEMVFWLTQMTAMMVPEAVRVGLRGALQELLLNAVEHGNLEISHDEKKQAVAEGRYDTLLDERAARPELRDRCVIVKVSYDAGAHRLMYRIADQGRGFDWRTMLDRKPDLVGLAEGSGRGLLLARSLFPDLSYNEQGNEVTFTVPLG